MKAIIKPQYVDHIPKAVKGKVIDLMTSKNQRDNLDWTMTELDLMHVKDREVELLSGGELQRLSFVTIIFSVYLKFIIPSVASTIKNTCI